jgi:hypothetical protein
MRLLPHFAMNAMTGKRIGVWGAFMHHCEVAASDPAVSF